MKKILKIIKDTFIDIKKNRPVLLFYVIANFINGVIVRLITTGAFSIRAMFFELGFVMILGSLSLLIKKKNNRVLYYYLTSLYMVACCVINAIYYNYYTSYVSVSLLATSVFVKDVGDAVLDFAIKPTDWIYLWVFIGL